MPVDYYKTELQEVKATPPAGLADEMRNLEYSINEAIKEFNKKTENAFEIKIECVYHIHSTFAGEVSHYADTNISVKLLNK